MSIIALIFGFACIVISILLNGKLTSFLDPASVFIVIGGLLAATVISYPMRQLKIAMKTLKIAYGKEKVDIRASIEQIITMANSARKEGLLSLENMTEDIHDPYLKKGIMLVVDGSDPELVKSVMETEIGYMEARHGSVIAIFNQMAAYAPAFGMTGTLIGLVNMLVNLNDAASLGPSMSVALVTTFYGVVLANLVFTPIARKLKTYSANEQLQKEILLEGILSIQDGENPRIIREKLEAFLAHMDIQAMNTGEAQKEIDANG